MLVATALLLPAVQKMAARAVAVEMAEALGSEWCRTYW
jgi:hypothetical protein